VCEKLLKIEKRNKKTPDTARVLFIFGVGG